MWKSLAEALSIRREKLKVLMSQHPGVTRVIELGLVAVVLCFFAGPVGVVYAVGFIILGAVIEGLAALMDPKTFATTKKPDDSNSGAP